MYKNMTQHILILHTDTPTKPHIASYERDTPIVDYQDWKDFRSLCHQRIDLWEVVSLPLGYVMLVAEDGLMRDLPLNPVASRMASQPIVGDSIVIHRDELDPSEVRYLSIDEVSFLRKLFLEPYTARTL